jgi:hypothetical protein
MKNTIHLLIPVPLESQLTDGKPSENDMRPGRDISGKKSILNWLDGKVVGFIDNAKPNFHLLVDDMADLLIKDFGVANVIKEKKRAASLPATKEMIARMLAHCDLVIAGSGD